MATGGQRRHDGEPQPGRPGRPGWLLCVVAAPRTSRRRSPPRARPIASWRLSSPIARANILHKAANILESRIPEVGRELTREEGKTLKEGIGETTRAVQILRYFAGEAQQPSGEHYPSANPLTLLYTTREPLGVVAAITPWNFPIAIPAWKIAPALAFGNTVVFKPASLTPLTAVRLVEALAEAGLPAGVLNLVTGSGGGDWRPVGARPARRRHHLHRLERDRRRVAAQPRPSGAPSCSSSWAARTRRSCSADADLDHALGHVVSGAMMSTGQKCTATSRAIVDRRVADRFTEMLAERIAALNVGNPLDAETQIGPLIDERAADRVASEVGAAARRGPRCWWAACALAAIWRGASSYRRRCWRMSIRLHGSVRRSSSARCWA